jgi:S1-C subfamily serine protease
MNWLDVFIVAFLAAAVMRGLEVGFIRQFFSTAGFFGGLFFGAWLQNHLMRFAHSPDTRAFVALSVILSAALLCMALGEYIGWVLKFKAKDTPLVNKVDRYTGPVLATATLLGAVWLGASMFSAVPNAAWQRQINGSRIVATLDKQLPPAPDVLTRLGKLIDPNSFPKVFLSLEPAPVKDAPLPDMGELNSAVMAVRASVVTVEGRGCGGIVEGSGFIANGSDIITNAHVVAGVRSPVVIDTSGKHSARVIWFDPDLDIAVLRTSGLAGTALKLDAHTAPNGTPAAIVGYPGGGGFTASGAAVLDSFIARGRNIYNEDETSRNIYSIKADVEEGNSGGPLINKDGTVIGVIFAKSTAYSQVGYALTMDGVIHGLQQAEATSTTVGTGSCTD